MKKYLLPECGSFYKANLHSHSTVSDGTKTPEELKEMYKNRGYSVFAYTDHDNFVCHNELSDEEFLVLNDNSPLIYIPLNWEHGQQMSEYF